MKSSLLYPDTVLEVRVRILGEMKKAVLIQSPAGDRAWIPRSWILRKKILEPGTWEIKIEELNWVQSFSR
jgi:hypothetical protein